MKKYGSNYFGRLGLMMSLLCLVSMPAFGGTAKPIPTGPFDAAGKPSVPDYYTTANWANSPQLAKFVDTLPGLGSGKANNLGQFLTVGKPDTITYPGSDYYEIELREYSERMHSDLPAPGTRLRGYVQVNKGTNIAPNTLPSAGICGTIATPVACSNNVDPDPIHYLSTTIIAERNRPVRIKFTNKLPVGAAGDLFIPVDTTVMGAGPGPAYPGGPRGQGDNCDNTVDGNTCASYTQNRASVHLHGGRTPWISDGTPHQWITPADEITPYPKGVSVQNVPDMPDPGDGSMTFYYTNQQSARLMFYHDHAFGITRLNVYVGEAAGYLITDKHEQDLISRGLIPPDQIPLVIQDKTYVDASEIRKYDPLWNWGTGTPDINGVRPPVEGDLWMSHVYMPAQTTLAGFGGVNPFGRWMYGPWFYPATAIEKGPVANQYYDPDCSSPIQSVFANCTTPGQPEQIPGTPHPSMGMEAFQDTAVVNGTAFPSLTVDPRAYRFRILNAASDRFWNLSLYEADSTAGNVSPDARLLVAGRSNKTEVKSVDASAYLAAQNNWPALWPVDGRDGGVPDPATRGPNFLQIANEGGFLPRPVVVEPQPITYITDPTAFWVGNVDKMGLALGPAERADVIVDFSAYAGKTLILYNDAPAAWPARVPGYDYFTGAPDMRDSGGFGAGGVYNPATGVWDSVTGNPAHGILPGYGPNTRTIMQIIVTGGASGLPAVDPPYTFNQSALENEFTTAATQTSLNPAPVKTLFERSQEPIIVGQASYSSVYPNSYFPTNYPWEGINQINDHFLKFVTLAGEPVIATTEPKGIHDEMGASFDPIYGRMSGNLAMQIPNPTTLTANLILYGFSDVPTELINNSTTSNVKVSTTQLNTLADGTQIWKISHNGVDTHPIHFHIFDVQLINRVGWDGQILMPEPNELGWKDTVKISPLEDTIVAVRPVAPALPFGVPNSLRPLNPAIPIGSTMGFNSIDPATGQAYVSPSPYAGGVTNILYDFKWEYVWHCHILNHEEMDMMRPIVLNVSNTIPDAPTALATPASFTGGSVTLTWTDPTPVLATTTPGNPKNEIGFRIYRCSGLNCTTFAQVGTALANATSYTETVLSSDRYSYLIKAYNAAGESTASNTVNTQSSDIINGVCGSSNGLNFSSIPTTGLCASGTESAVSYIAGVLTWTCSGIDPTPANNPQNASCTAYIPSYTLNFLSGGNGTLTGNTSQTVIYGLSATTVTAVPITGYHFVNWTEGATVVSTAPALTATNVVANHTYTANFAIDTFTVTFTAGVNGTLSGPAAQTVNYAANATTVTAVANPGFIFVNWIEGATVAGTLPALTISNVTANHAYTAIFSAAYSVTLDQCVTGPTLVASGAMPTYTFNTTGFNVAAQANGVPITLTGSTYTYPTGVTANQAITATYTPNPAGTVAARIVRGATALDFTTLQAAYIAAANNETIMLLAGNLTGSFTANIAKTVYLKGGYNAAFTSNCGITKVGNITLGIGTVLFDRVSM
ncbi:MAG: multicopper oxidase domain-containing protein [Geobacter sp.]|nr:multicopper oxidase domain-containing protein [Geobacter sp.]